MTRPLRRLFDVPIQPVSGSMFQPTGFPDIGAALFERPVRERPGEFQSALLVESAQSMANRLEATAWDASVSAPVSLFEALPYVRVVDGDGHYLTSSRTEAHRLASAFVKDAVSAGGASGVDFIGTRLALQNDRPIPPRAIAAAVFALDPFCLIHGVFFADKKWPGQPKIARAVSASIEAHDVRRVDSGGVKKDHVRHNLQDAVGGTSEGYGTVPFHRTDWTAAEIVVSFNLDLGQFRAYGLGEPATELLEAIALWEIRTLLDGGLKLRTACDLEVITPEIRDRAGEPLPEADQLERAIKGLIVDVGDLVGERGPFELTWTAKSAKSAKS